MYIYYLSCLGNWLDRSIGFERYILPQGLFYAYRFGNRVYIYTYEQLFLKSFFLHSVLSKTNNFFNRSMRPIHEILSVTITPNPIGSGSNGYKGMALFSPDF